MHKNELIPGAYARILDEELKSLLSHTPELVATLRKIDDEEEPAQYALLLAQIFDSAIRQCKKDERVDLINRLVEIIGAKDGMDYLLRRKVLASREMLISVAQKGISTKPWPLPETPLNASCLFTGSAGTPSLDHELRQEMRSADRVDFLVSFIKRSGLRLLMPAIEEITNRGVQVRVLTTSYMGASDPDAIATLVRCPNVTLKVSYDTEHTRLHAKAYHFYRRNEFSTAYIGSANLSGAAITSGLEWTVKITEQDQPAVLCQFRGEFESYWENEGFEYCGEGDLNRFRRAIKNAKARIAHPESRFLAEITPRPFQERILENIQAERKVHNSYKNLIVAATGTGKTVISAFDYLRFSGKQQPRPKLLFLAHRIEILEQARDCFRSVLRDENFGDILGGSHEPTSTDYLFCNIASAKSRGLTDSLLPGAYEYIVVDEAHHSAASTYRPLFSHFNPQIWLGLTATPERMDGSSILTDFNNRIAAEIRLPEALEERLLCPFHYFGITDPVSLKDDHFWRNGQYSVHALDAIYTGDDIRAKRRVDALFSAFEKYQPIEDQAIRAIGFCASVKHAEYMKSQFIQRGHAAEVLLGATDTSSRSEIVRQFREGGIRVLFTVDVLNEGFDLPQINLVMLLRPTQSLTIFLQQLGRGLRHSPGKECLTVLDLVGQQHRKYRIDRKYAALLPRQRLRIDAEVEAEFPHLPAGCSICLERVARENVLKHIRQTLRDFNTMTLESLVSQSARLNRQPTFSEFISESEIDALSLLKKDTWSGWKAKSVHQVAPAEPDITRLKTAMFRLASRNSPRLLNDTEGVLGAVVAEQTSCYQYKSKPRAVMQYYLMNHPASPDLRNPNGLTKLLRRNPCSSKDLLEIAAWRKSVSNITPFTPKLPFECPLELHAAYGFNEIKAALGIATFQSPGPMGTGVVHVPDSRAYIHFVTFIKQEKDFSPSTRYKDYPLSRSRLHWQTQATTSQESPTGKNHIFFKERGYTILICARVNKQESGCPCPFTYLGPMSNLVHYSGNRPISMIWDLGYPIPAEMFERVKMGG